MDLLKDIPMLMRSPADHAVYVPTKGRVTDDDDPPVKDAVTTGLQNLVDGLSNPLKQYNAAFVQLQARLRL
jgi:hypothetical protein